MPKSQVDARKATVGAEAALELVRKAAKLVVVKGAKVNLLDIKNDHPDDESIKKLVLGPTGNLRAPTLRVGNTLLVGFGREAYEDVLG